MSQIILVDSKNLVFRTHWTHRALTSKEGKPTSVLYGVLNNILGIAKRLPGANFAFVWDGDGRTWRHELLAKPLMPALDVQMREVPAKPKLRERPDWMQQQVHNSLRFIGGGVTGGTKTTTPTPKTAVDPVSSPRIGGLKGRPQGYKAHRADLHNSDEHQIALAQIPELKMVLKNLGFRQFEVPRLECDDLLGILQQKLRKEFDEVVIYSGDKDFYSLIADDVRQLKGLQDGKLWWAEQSEIEMEFGIPVSDWVRLKALIGDPSDNIPHLFDKVGPVTAAGWIRQGLDPSLEKFESHSSQLRQKFSVLTVRRNEIYLQARWQEVYRNYILSKIITQTTAPEVQYCASDLVRECSGLERVSMMRHPIEHWSRWFSQWMISLDMAELWGRRMEFTQIP